MDNFRYRTMLADIAKEMRPRELNAMKFLCSEIIPKGTREDVEDVLDLWVLLEERDKLSPHNTAFLRYLLQNATDKRTDLLQILQNYESTVQRQSDTAQPLLQTSHEFPSNDMQPVFDIIVSDIGKNWRQLSRKLGISEAEIDFCGARHPQDLREQIRLALTMWAKKEEQVTPEALCSALRASQQVLLAQKIERIL